MKPFLASAIFTALVVPACSEQPGSPQDSLATSTSAASSTTTSITFRRGSGALDVGREICDDRRDPRQQNLTAVTMEGLRLADVTAQLTPSATDGPRLTIRVNGTSDVRIVMRSQLGNAPAVEQIVSGFDTSATPITFHTDIALTSRDVDPLRSREKSRRRFRRQRWAWLLRVHHALNVAASGERVSHCEINVAKTLLMHHLVSS